MQWISQNLGVLILICGQIFAFGAFSARMMIQIMQLQKRCDKAEATAEASANDRSAMKLEQEKQKWINEQTEKRTSLLEIADKNKDTVLNQLLMTVNRINDWVEEQRAEAREEQRESAKKKV